jgi:uncharacterized integral membrane protein
MARELPDAGGRRVQPALIAGVILALALLAFVLQNTDDTDVDWLFFSFSQPKWLLLLITSAIAIVGAELLSYAIRRRRSD